mgnify:CR=1 FL=1
MVSKILITQSAATLCILLLATAALGFWSDYTSLRMYIFITFLVLVALAAIQHYTEFAIAFVLSALLFNPYFPAHLSQNIWIVLDVLFIAGLLFFVFWTTNSYQKGSRFEKYLANQFPESKYKIVDRTRDNGKYLARHVESDGNPDLRLRNLETRNEFAIECKWRAKWRGNPSHGDVGIFWNPKWTERYLAYGRNNKIPVFLSLGVGGTPEKPKEVYIVPMEVLNNWSFLKRSHFIGNNQPIT